MAMGFQVFDCGENKASPSPSKGGELIWFKENKDFAKC